MISYLLSHFQAIPRLLLKFLVDIHNKGVCVKLAQSRPTLCDPMDCSLQHSSICGILQARILEWVAFPSPGDLPNPGIEPGAPALQADALPSEPPAKLK